MVNLSPVWLEIFSEWLINLSVAWFAVVFIEPQINSPFSNFWLLISKCLLGIISLVFAKILRERSKKYD